MPLKRSLAQRVADRFCSITSMLTLPFIALLPLPTRQKVMERLAWFYWPLIRSLLLPAVGRDPHSTQPLPLPGKDLETEEATILFGGNDCLRNEVAPLVEGIAFPCGRKFSTQDRPLLLMPLLQARSEKAYIQKAFDNVTTFLAAFPNLKKVRIIGHSLGAAIAIQLTAKMRKESPQYYSYSLALDRSFSSLAEVACYQYPTTGWIMERSLGLIWSFRSAETLISMAHDPQVFCRLYQVSPDHVIGTAELVEKLRQHFNEGQWPERWSYHTLGWPHDNLAHILPFEEAFSSQESRKADTQSCSYQQNPAPALTRHEPQLPE